MTYPKAIAEPKHEEKLPLAKLPHMSLEDCMAQFNVAFSARMGRTLDCNQEREEADLRNLSRYAHKHGRGDLGFVLARYAETKAEEV